MVLQRIVKPKTQRGKRALVHKEPKIHENNKKCMLVKGGNTSLLVTQVLKELHMLKKPDAVLFRKKNITRPFEDQTSLEFFSDKADASLFVFGSHSKKRPNNLVIGRLFDSHVLDMVEFGVEKFVSMQEVEGPKCSSGVKPCLIFSGDAFEQDTEYKRVKNLLVDFFRGPVVTNIRLAGLEHVVSVSAIDGKIYIRNFRVLLKKSGSRTPRVELENMGPSLDLVMRRTKLASDDLFSRALKQPKTAKPRKIKNISHDPFGSKLGRIHMQSQDLGKLQTRKVKALKKRKSESAATTDNDNDSSPTSKKTRRVAE